MTDVQIDLYIKEFEEKKKDFKKRWEADCPNDEKEYAAYRIKPIIDSDEDPKFENDSIKTYGSIMHNGDLIGFLKIEIPISIDLASDIIEAQVKKYNKVKTMLEATK